MKLSPKTQYKLAFWSITGPALIPFIALVLLAIINPFWFRADMINWTEKAARKLAEWRDGTKFVKYYHDKAHLFDTLKA
jgi:hypothetical protein